VKISQQKAMYPNKGGCFSAKFFRYSFSAKFWWWW